MAQVYGFFSPQGLGMWLMMVSDGLRRLCDYGVYEVSAVRYVLYEAHRASNTTLEPEVAGMSGRCS